MTGLYVHIPWCIRKCPYCDFNSHEKRSDFDEAAYVDRLVEDLGTELSSGQFDIGTVYFGGGTPSLFGPDSFAKILGRFEQDSLEEVTMEANPGTTEYSDLNLYREAGITRLSIGVQSFDSGHLETLGRIHGPNEAQHAIEKAMAAGFDSVNLDLMYGLPHQSINQALKDLDVAINYQPQHISWYELTIEPNTVFAKTPPPLSTIDYRADMEDAGVELLSEHGYRRYEVSAYARSDQECRHNLNYWTFGDYIGVGAGAHGKKTTQDGIFRTTKIRQPGSYLSGTAGFFKRVPDEDLPAEFMMNALRLLNGVEERAFSMNTGLEIDVIRETVEQLRSWKLMHPTRLQLSSQGLRQLNGVVAQFLNS